MTIKSFWAIILKILGIYLLFGSLTVVPQSISTMFFAGVGDNSNGLIMSILIIALITAIYIFILIVFIFKTSWLIEKLRLEKGFSEDKIDLSIANSQIFSIAIIVIGGLMFIDSLPIFCKHIFTNFQQKALFNQSPESGWVIFYFVKTVVGYLLMTNSKFLVAFIVKKQRIDDQMQE